MQILDDLDKNGEPYEFDDGKKSIIEQYSNIFQMKKEK